MSEPMTDERLADIRKWVEKPQGLVPNRFPGCGHNLCVIAEPAEGMGREGGCRCSVPVLRTQLRHLRRNAIELIAEIERRMT